MNGLSDKSIPKGECATQVRQMGKLMGLLYLHFAKTLVKELGEKEGQRLILQAVHSYGSERGRAVRQLVDQQGLEPTVENYFKFNDLPELGWETDETGVTNCCYAEPWMERGEESLGQLYCEVDIAKMKAYNPQIRIQRTKSLLKGDSSCHYIFE